MAVVNRHYPATYPYRRKIGVQASVNLESGHAASIDTSGDAGLLDTAEIAFAGFVAVTADNSAGAADAINVELIPEGIAELTITGVGDADHDSVVFASGSNAFTLTASTNLPIGRVVEVRGANTAYVYFQSPSISSLQFDAEETATGTFTLSPWGATKIDSSGGVITGTLGSGKFIGQIKTIVLSDAANNPSTVSITLHQDGEPEVATFDALNETGVFMWTGNEWVTIFATCTFV